MVNGAKNYCFTWNNYNEDNLRILRSLYDNEDAPIRYLIFQQEAGEKGTPHLQGYVAFSKKLTLSKVKKVGFECHLSVAKGSPAQNKVYCSKVDSRLPDTETEEFGEIPPQSGSRSDLDAFKEAARGGAKRSCILEEHSEIVAKYPRFVKEYMQLHRQVNPVPNHDLRFWQSLLKERLEKPPGDREIIFVYDPKGNAGKTWFAKHWCSTHEFAQFMEPGKKADMAFNISEETTCLFVNVTRQQVDHLQYSFLEACKDGLVFSPKYESGMKYLKPMHVVCMMNQEPNYELLSSDRYDVINLKNT